MTKKHTTRTVVRTKTSVSVHTHVAAWIAVTAGTLGITSVAFGIAYIPFTAYKTPKNLLQAKVETCQLVCKEQFGRCASKYPLNECQVTHDICVQKCSASAPRTPTPPSSPCAIQVEKVAITNPGLLREADPHQSTMFDTYKIKVTGGDVILDGVNVSSKFDSANIARISVGLNGIMQGSGILPSGVQRNMFIPTAGVLLARDTTTELAINASLAPIISSTIVGGATTGVARSGASVALGLTSNLTTGLWNSLYSNKYNLKATCRDTGSFVYASGPVATAFGPTFVARQAVIEAMTSPLSSSSLASGHNDLIKIVFFAGSHEASIKKLSFELSPSQTVAGSWGVSSFVLRRGPSDIPPSDYRVLDERGNDLRTATTTPRIVTFVFNDERLIQGTSAGNNTFTVSAIITGSLRPGDALITRFLYRSGQINSTGYLTTDTARVGGSLLPGPHLNESTNPNGSPSTIGYFLWSDMSEIPHRPSPGSSEGSRDWIPGEGVLVSRDTQVLAR